MTRAELIAALEKAEEPSRELDRAVALGLGWIFDGDGWQEPDGTRHSGIDEYTASIDAALTLVGAAAWTAEFVDDDAEYRASVWNGDRWRNGHSRHNAAIALCIAALKARGES